MNIVFYVFGIVLLFFCIGAVFEMILRSKKYK